MTTAVVTVAPNERIDAARRLLRKHDIRHLPVTDGDRLMGIIAESDLRMAEAASGGAGPVVVEDAMTMNVIAVAGVEVLSTSEGED